MLEHLSSISARVEVGERQTRLSATPCSAISAVPRRVMGGAVQIPLTLFPLAQLFADNRNWGLGREAERLAGLPDHSRHQPDSCRTAGCGEKQDGML
jgi:hypothetical protein